jgi:hypothetical protein
LLNLNNGSNDIKALFNLAFFNTDRFYNMYREIGRR